MKKHTLWPLSLYLIFILGGVAWGQGREIASAAARAADAVCDKHVVVLGELPSRGEGAAFEAKSQIVRRLIGQCGFDTLLFEAPIYDFVGFEVAASKRTVTPVQLDRSIGGFWIIRELSDWRAWLYQQAISGKLFVGGLDDQVSVTSDYARATLPHLIASLTPAARSAECEQAVSRNLYWRYGTETPFDEAEQGRLRGCADEAFKKALRNSAKPLSPEQLMIENLAGFVKRQTKSPKAWDRDKVMFRNFLWYSSLKNGALGKTIIWTATVHAARKQGPLPDEPLGSRLSGLLTYRLGVIGFTAFTGRSSMAGRPAKDLPEAPPGSLEAVTDRENEDSAFINSAELKRLGKLPSRLFGNFGTAEDWSRYFDGVLVIRREFAPTFEPKESTPK